MTRNHGIANLSLVARSIGVVAVIAGVSMTLNIMMHGSNEPKISSTRKRHLQKDQRMEMLNVLHELLDQQ
jgi:hypothetical protein